MALSKQFHFFTLQVQENLHEKFKSELGNGTGTEGGSPVYSKETMVSSHTIVSSLVCLFAKFSRTFSLIYDLEETFGVVLRRRVGREVVQNGSGPARFWWVV